MPAKVLLRELTVEEHQPGERLARSRTDEARLVQRARVIGRLAVGERPGAVADRLGNSRSQLDQRLHRFNAEGLAALDDRPRLGRPHTDDAYQRAAVGAARRASNIVCPLHAEPTHAIESTRP